MNTPCSRLRFSIGLLAAFGARLIKAILPGLLLRQTRVLS